MTNNATCYYSINTIEEMTQSNNASFFLLAYLVLLRYLAKQKTRKLHFFTNTLKHEKNITWRQMNHFSLSILLTVRSHQTLADSTGKGAQLEIYQVCYRVGHCVKKLFFIKPMK